MAFGSAGFKPRLKSAAIRIQSALCIGDRQAVDSPAESIFQTRGVNGFVDRVG
jgi:hypothetical protein